MPLSISIITPSIWTSIHGHLGPKEVLTLSHPDIGVKRALLSISIEILVAKTITIAIHPLRPETNLAVLNPTVVHATDIFKDIHAMGIAHPRILHLTPVHAVLQLTHILTCTTLGILQ
jgi:hypothetical protein